MRVRVIGNIEHMDLNTHFYLLLGNPFYMKQTPFGPIIGTQKGIMGRGYIAYKR